MRETLKILKKIGDSLEIFWKIGQKKVKLSKLFAKNTLKTLKILMKKINFPFFKEK